MDAVEQFDLLEAAALGRINERCAMAYLHDVRGTMQALFSAVELLGRSARTGNADTARIDKACALAKRAIASHEKSILDTLEALTLQSADAAAVDLAGLVTNAVHFLRNDAALKGVAISVSGGESARAVDGGAAPITIMAERAKFQTLLVGLVAAAIDATPAGETLPVLVRRADHWAEVTIGSDAGYRSGTTPDCAALPATELTRVFAQRYLAAGGGGLDVVAGTHPHGSLRLYYPMVA